MTWFVRSVPNARSSGQTTCTQNDGGIVSTEVSNDLCLPRGGAEDEHVLADGLRVEVVQGDVRGLV